MKKIKLSIAIALLGAMSFGAFSAYDYATMSTDHVFLLANIEALAGNENGPVYCPGGSRICAEGAGINFYQR